MCSKYLVREFYLSIPNSVTILKAMYSNSYGIIINWISGFGVGKGQTPLSAMRQVFVHFFFKFCAHDCCISFLLHVQEW